MTIKKDMLDDIAWEKLQKYISDNSYQEFLKQIDPEVFRRVLDKKNHPKVLQLIMKKLKETDPENATKVYAEIIIEAMELLAQSSLNEKSISISKVRTSVN